MGIPNWNTARPSTLNYVGRNVCPRAVVGTGSLSISPPGGPTLSSRATNPHTPGVERLSVATSVRMTAIGWGRRFDHFRRRSHITQPSI